MQTILTHSSTGTPMQWTSTLDSAFELVYEWYVHDQAYSLEDFHRFLYDGALELFDYENAAMREAWRAWLNVTVPPMAQELFEANQDAGAFLDEDYEEA